MKIEKIIEDRKHDALDKGLYEKAETIARYLTKSESEPEKVPLIAQVDRADGDGSLWFNYKTTFEQGGLRINLFRKFNLFPRPALIRVEENEKIVFEAYKEDALALGGKMRPQIEITGYVPKEGWERKFHELYLEADAIKQKKQKEEIEKERHKASVKEQERLAKFGLL